MRAAKDIIDELADADKTPVERESTAEMCLRAQRTETDERRREMAAGMLCRLGYERRRGRWRKVTP